MVTDQHSGALDANRLVRVQTLEETHGTKLRAAKAILKTQVSAFATMAVRIAVMVE